MTICNMAVGRDFYGYIFNFQITIFMLTRTYPHFHCGPMVRGYMQFGNADHKKIPLRHNSKQFTISMNFNLNFIVAIERMVIPKFCASGSVSNGYVKSFFCSTFKNKT